MRRFFALALALAGGLSLAPAHAAPRGLLANPPEALARKLGSGLPLPFAPRPSVAGGVLPARSSVGVTIRFASPPSEQDVRAVAETDATVSRRRDGSPRIVDRDLLARATPRQILAIAAAPGVERIELDGAPFGVLPPMDATAAELGLPHVWGLTAGELPLDGSGVTVCDSDSGIDVFHPSFFRADGGYYSWIDVDHNGAFNPGSDGVDLDGDGVPETVRVHDSVITSPYSSKPRYGSEGPTFVIGIDWLYVDVNGSGQRDFGRDGGFDDAAPSFGEPWLLIDDVNGNKLLDPGEKLVLLGSSKIRTARVGKDVYRRGENLIDTPRGDESYHGTSSAAIIAGGHVGLDRFVGVAPGAELIMAVREQGTELLALSDFCVDEGARVVLHEYAPWAGYFMDGSEPLEKHIDKTSAEGVAHVNPAGNLSGSKKLYKRLHPAGQETVIELEAPPQGAYHFLGLSLLWRDPSRKLEVVLEDPNAVSKLLPINGNKTLFEDWDGTLTIYAQHSVSSRGTVKLDVYLFEQSNTPAEIPNGSYQLHVKDPSDPGAGDLQVVAFVQDDVSGWGQGLQFPEHSSEDHLIGFPGTADSGIAVAAYTHNDWFGQGGVGDRAGYSGRGFRIDGEEILDISGPADPIVAGYKSAYEASYETFAGTSGSSPHVAGVAALLVQQDPARTGAAVRQAIRDGAFTDAFTGAVPNHDWGYGKLRAYAALFGTDPPAGTPPTIASQTIAALVAADVQVDLAIGDADDPMQSLVVDLDLDYDGLYEQRLAGPSFVTQFAATGFYYAKARVTDQGGHSAAALLRFEVTDPPPPTTSKKKATKEDDGCGCSTPGAGGPSGWWLLLGMVLALARRRPRHLPPPLAGEGRGGGAPLRSRVTLWRRCCLPATLALSGLGCGGGLALHPVVTLAEKPAKVVVLFSVDAAGAPVTNLAPEAFTVREGGQEPAAITAWELANVDLGARQRTLLLLDLSGGLDESARMDVAAAAGTFVEQVGKSGQVALYAFGGSPKPHELVGFGGKASADEVIAKIVKFADPDSSTDLHGAFKAAYELLQQKLASESLGLGTLVVVSRGPDLAARVKQSDVTNAIREAERQEDGKPRTKIARHAIGIGEPAKQAGLSSLASESPAMVASTKELGPALDALAKDILARAQSYYLLAYCATARAGKHTLRVDAKRTVPGADGKPTEQSGGFSHTFDATGFAAGCKPDIPAEWRGKPN